MGSHACDRVIRSCVIVTLLATLAGCSSRSTNPEDNGEPDSPIHEPWEDEEAEEMALLMSGEVCAPRELYECVQNDLATIRNEWGDSIPELRAIRYRSFYQPSYLSLSADQDAYIDMQEGRYSAWDSLNNAYGFERAVYHDDASGDGPYIVSIDFSPRLNPFRLMDAYAGLPGVQWIQPTGFSLGDWPCIYGYNHEFGRSYLFRDASGDCPMGCGDNNFWYFRSTDTGIEFVGGWPDPDGSSPPSWWDEASLNWDLYFQKYVIWRREDTRRPSPVTDLLAGNPKSNEIAVGWTAPSDSGYSGRVAGYELRYSDSLFTDENWDRTWLAGRPHPSLPGTHERFIVKDLRPTTNYYFAVKSTDASGNWSAISNIANVSTTPAYGWTTFDSTNSSLKSGRIEAMATDGRGGVWIGTYQGLAHFDGSQWLTHTFPNAPGAGDGVTGIAVDALGNMWCITYRGVHVFDGSNWELYTERDIGLPGTPYRVAAAASGHIWVGGVHAGVAEFDGTHWIVHQLPISNPYATVCVSVAFDASGDPWISTLGLGVYRYDGSAWTTYTEANSGLGANSVYAIAAGSDGNVWFVHDDYYWGVSRFDGAEWERFSTSNSLLPSNNNRFVTVDSFDRTWLSSAGVARYDGVTWSNRKTTTSGLVSDQVRTIAEDAMGNMWFGTDKGVSRLAVEYIETYFGETSKEGL